MSSKAGKFLQFIYGTMFPIYVITETWFNDSILDNEFFPKEYIIYRRDRSSANSKKAGGGGVLIAVHSSISSALISTDSTLELLCVKLTLHRQVFYLFALYIPPDLCYSSSTSNIVTAYCENISNIIFNACDEDLVLVVGDFNLSKLNWLPDDESSSFLPSNVSSVNECICIDSMLSSGLQQINHIFNLHNRMLDLVFCSSVDEFKVNEGVVSFVCNDVHHKSLEINLIKFDLIHPGQGSNCDQYFYDFRRVDSDGFNSYLEGCDWNYWLGSDSINECIDSFYNFISVGFNRFVPISKKKCSSRPPWFDRDLSNLDNRKNKAYDVWKQTLLMADKFKYVQLVKQFNICYKSSYAKYISRIQSEINDDPKKFWKFVNSKRNSHCIPSTMFYKETKCSDVSKICNLFAKFFKDSYNDSVMIHNICDDCNLFSSNQIIIPDIQPEDIIKALNTFNDGCGPDGIPSIFLKQFANILAIPLSILFNKSLASGIFPDAWKLSKIIPVFKGGRRDDVANYRGIAILSSIPKLFESIVCEFIYFQVKNGIFIKQHGFFQGRSTSTNLVEFTNKVISHMESRSQVDVVYLDFSKAFDSLNHNLVIRKLRAFGFSSGILQWLGSYLTDRSQYVCVQSTMSDCIKVTSGVPQGSHLGPLVFNLFINDIINCISSSECLLYADDLKIFLPIRNLRDVGKLQDDINAICNWCSENLLDLNVKKCKVMTFHRITKPFIANYMISTTPLERVFIFKDLGITFVPTLSFNRHIEIIIARAMTLLGFIRRVSKEFSVSVFIRLYYAYVRSQLEYASVVWCPFYDSTSQRVESVQKKCLIGLACKAGDLKFNDMPSWECIKNLPSYLYRCRMLSIYTLEERRNFAASLFVYDVLLGRIDSPFLLSSLNLCVPRLTSRTHNLLTVNFHRSNYGANEPINLMAKQFNLHNNVFDFSISRYEFKNRMKLNVL